MVGWGGRGGRGAKKLLPATIKASVSDAICPAGSPVRRGTLRAELDVCCSLFPHLHPLYSLSLFLSLSLFPLLLRSTPHLALSTGVNLPLSTLTLYLPGSCHLLLPTSPPLYISFSFTFSLLSLSNPFALRLKGSFARCNFELCRTQVDNRERNAVSLWSSIQK